MQTPHRKVWELQNLLSVRQHPFQIHCSITLIFFWVKLCINLCVYVNKALYLICLNIFTTIRNKQSGRNDLHILWINKKKHTQLKHLHFHFFTFPWGNCEPKLQKMPLKQWPSWFPFSYSQPASRCLSQAQLLLLCALLKANAQNL